jgi:hypothetical protein
MPLLVVAEVKPFDYPVFADYRVSKGFHFIIQIAAECFLWIDSYHRNDGARSRLDCALET